MASNGTLSDKIKKLRDDFVNSIKEASAEGRQRLESGLVHLISYFEDTCNSFINDFKSAYQEVSEKFKEHPVEEDDYTDSEQRSSETATKEDIESLKEELRDLFNPEVKPQTTVESEVQVADENIVTNAQEKESAQSQERDLTQLRLLDRIHTAVNKVGEFASNLVNRVTGFYHTFEKYVGDRRDAFVLLLMSIFTLYAAIKSNWDKIVSWVSESVQAIGDYIEEAIRGIDWNGIIQGALDASAWIVNKVVEPLISSIFGEAFTDKLGEMFAYILGAVNKVLEVVNSIVSLLPKGFRPYDTEKFASWIEEKNKSLESFWNIEKQEDAIRTFEDKYKEYIEGMSPEELEVYKSEKKYLISNEIGTEADSERVQGYSDLQRQMRGMLLEDMPENVTEAEPTQEYREQSVPQGAQTSSAGVNATVSNQTHVTIVKVNDGRQNRGDYYGSGVR